MRVAKTEASTILLKSTKNFTDFKYHNSKIRIRTTKKTIGASFVNKNVKNLKVIESL